MFLLIVFSLGSFTGIAADRIKRFLNAEVHNRIDVLSKSQAEHTTWLKYIALGATIALSLLFVLFILATIVRCYCARTRTHHTTRRMIDSQTLDTILRPFSSASPYPPYTHFHSNYSSSVKPHDFPLNVAPAAIYPMLKF